MYYFSKTLVRACLATKENELQTVDPLLQAAASNFFDENFVQNLLSKNYILLKASIWGRLQFKGGF